MMNYGADLKGYSSGNDHSNYICELIVSPCVEQIHHVPVLLREVDVVQAAERRSLICLRLFHLQSPPDALHLLLLKSLKLKPQVLLYLLTVTIHH